LSNSVENPRIETAAPPAAASKTERSQWADDAATRTSFLLPMLSLSWRELIRFVRQRSRVVGMVATPLLFWLFLGSGLGSSFHTAPTAADPAQGGGYLQYFFPGTIISIVLFTSFLSTISVIDDRKEGFLLSVLVAPINRAALVLGKVLGGTAQAVVPGFLVLLLAPAVGFHLHPMQLVLMTLVLFLNSFCITAVGFFFAWRMDSVQGFHVVFNIVLLPLWLLSGALFPASGASVWMQWVMRVNPLTYGLAALRQLLYWDLPGVGAGVPSFALSLVVTILFGAAMLFAALMWTGRPAAKNLG
jgi:ABC-2 type transport system permease protein